MKKYFFDLEEKLLRYSVRNTMSIERKQK